MTTPSDIQRWLIEQGLAGLSAPELMQGFCDRCRAAGLPLSHAIMFIDTLHPVYEGGGVRWQDDQPDQVETFEYGRSTEGEALESWTRSPFYTLLERGGSEMRLRPGDEAWARSRLISSLQERGHTDYVAFVHRLADEAQIGEMDCVYSHWVTRAAEGFSETDLAALREVVPALALAMKSAAMLRIAHTLVQVYLGRDAGARVLSGKILRGVAERIDAVLWFSDLRGYTAISDRVAPAEIIPLLNDYADAVITAIHENGGDVLKLMGDGLLAVFTAPDAVKAAKAALAAEAAFRRNLVPMNTRRREEGRPELSAYVGFHFGDVFFGNIGSRDRLDFTVVGPAVNEVSRIVSMCRSVDREVLASSAFRDLLDSEGREQFVSVGRFALRGVGRAQDLYTLDPALKSAT